MGFEEVNSTQSVAIARTAELAENVTTIPRPLDGPTTDSSTSSTKSVSRLNAAASETAPFYRHVSGPFPLGRLSRV